MKKLLIVYDSWSCGNTERIAKILQCTAGGDLWKLDTAEPYRGSYSEVVDQGQREVERGLEPELKPLGVDPAVSLWERPRGGIIRWHPPSKPSCTSSNSAAKR